MRLILLALVVAYFAAPEPNYTAKCVVVNIVDGDTVDVMIPTTYRVRLIDCWAPESHETKNPKEKALGLAAKAELTKYAKDKQAIVSIPTSGTIKTSLTLDRVLGSVWLIDSEQSLSEYMVSKKLAGKTKSEQQELLK